MNKKQLKQRIVGAIVLVGLGVIFIPMILNQGDDASPITGSNIPTKPLELVRMPKQIAPAHPEVPIANRDLPRLVDEHTPPMTQTDVSITETKPITSVTKPVEAKISTPAKSVSAKAEPKIIGKSRAWVVQVASFSEQKKAIKLRDRLRKAKHPTFVESVNGKKGLYYRVRVGPLIKRNKAEKLKKKIAKQFKLKDALVMAHP